MVTVSGGVPKSAYNKDWGTSGECRCLLKPQSLLLSTILGLLRTDDQWKPKRHVWSILGDPGKTETKVRDALNNSHIKVPVAIVTHEQQSSNARRKSTQPPVSSSPVG